MISDYYLHRWASAADQCVRVDAGAEVHELNKRIERDLLYGAWVVAEVGLRGLLTINESRAASSRGRDAVED